MEESERARRWALVVPHRERLLKVARGLVPDKGDAEACVQEAMLRCVTFDDLDESNVVGFLVVTTRRLCVDHHRRHARDGHLSARLTGMTTPDPRVEDVVCDRAEAAWVVSRLDLPERQRAVVRARSDGRSPREIAAYLDVSYKTVETLLYRARTRARAELDKAYGLLLLLGRAPRPGWDNVAIASAAAVATASMLFAPHPVAPPVALPPAAPVVVAPEAPVRAAAPRPAAPAATPRPARVAPVAVRPAPPAPAPVAADPAPLPRPCYVPPYGRQPCPDVDPGPGPGTVPVLSFLACVRYGIEQSATRYCRPAP